MDDLESILRDSGFPYEIIQHGSQLRSAQEGADYFKIETGQTARTLILRSDNNDPLSVDLRGSRSANFDAENQSSRFGKIKRGHRFF